MEAEPSRPADGQRSGRQEQQHVAAESSLGSCPPQQPQLPPNPRPVHRALGRLQHRQPKRTDLLLRLQQQQAVAWQQSDNPGPSGGSFFSPSSPSTSSLHSTSSTQGEHGQGRPAQSSQEGVEGVSSPRKGEKKPAKPGKYVCTYCGRPCAKPSVLQKHIRSHTGERPYPCAPCGFSFKTKSNLYKHRKSHAHRIKAGLASSRDEHSMSGPEGSGVGEDPEEHTEGESTESEEETGQHTKSSSKEMLGQHRKGGKDVLGGSEESQRPEDSQAVKQRLALRLSERKRGPMASPDDPPSSLSTSSSSLGPGSKGSTESGYFSGSGSTELSQVSPPSASAKTYAEIILGKYGRLGGQQRSPHQQQQQHPHSSLSSSSGAEEKSISFNVPKTQVIEHITKLITINEAVVDTSEIDSVKPRRSSLSRKSSMESPKFSAPKDPYAFDHKGESPGPSGLRQLHSPEADPPGAQEPASMPLLRSHSMPSSISQGEPSTLGTMSPRRYRLCQSFDEQQAVVAEMRAGHSQRTLKRQPAIEVPLGAEVMLEEAGRTSSSSSARATELPKPPQQQQQQKTPSQFECESCGAHFQQGEDHEAHRGVCPRQQTPEQESRDVRKTCREDRPPMMMHYKFRALAMAVRKRRKEESLEEDPPSPGSVSMSGSSADLVPVPSRTEHSQALSGVSSQIEPKEQQQHDRKGVSVIQHTSSFEKQESISMESQEPALRESQQTQAPEPKPSPSTSRLIRQPNIQVPEILVTVEPDADMPSVSPPVAPSSSKEAERTEEFQWPQRSQTLAQLPAEKLPPKKKRLRLAEAAQSSGESSFESMSLSRSPSQESNVSHASSLSASFEDAARSECVVWAVTCQSSQMLMVPPPSHQHHQSHKEMRRSASEQAPASPQQTEQCSETRSKSFDYGSLSAQQPVSTWQERRKYLLVKHATLGEPEQEEGASTSHLSRGEAPKPGPSRPVLPPLYSTEASPRFSLESTGKASQLLRPQIFPPPQDLFPLQPRGQQAFPSGCLSQLLPATTAVSEALSTQIIHRGFLPSQSGPPLVQIRPSAQTHTSERLGIPLHHLPALVPLRLPSGSRPSQSLYLPVSPRHVPSPLAVDSRASVSSVSSDLIHPSLVTVPYPHPRPVITTCLAQLTPVASLVVPVRLQTHIPTYASAMYTTLSQILACTRSQEPVSCTVMSIMGQAEREKLQRSYLKVPSPEIVLPLPLPAELASGSGEACGPLGAGGSKRMLSPAASLELSTEAQRHQKRVKEEEEEAQHKAGDEEEVAEGDVDKNGGEKDENQDTGRKVEEGEKKRIEVTAVKVERGQEKVPRTHTREEKKEEGKESTDKTSQKKEEVPVVEEGVERLGTPSYPNLHTSTSVNWCYLNYVKPNPSAQRDPRNSVYSTWSVSAHNPNLPGLSTKMVLSLLCSKQKHSAETYTMATAPTPAKSKMAAASSRTPHVTEVHATPPGPLTEVKDHPQPEEEKNKEASEEEGPSTSTQGEPPRVRIFEGGYKSNEDYIYVRGRGRGKYICGECGIRCKKPSMLKKHIRTHTDVRPYVCKHCNFAFKTKGNLTKHMKSKAHGKKCQAMGVSESSLDEPESEETVGSDERACGSEEQEEHQFSDVEESEDDDDDDEEEESASHDDPPSSCSSDTQVSTGGCSNSSKQSQPGTSEPEPPVGHSPSPGQEHSPRGVWLSRRAASPSSRRALFSRRGWKASPRTFSPSSESCSPSRSLSPRLELSSPIRSLSPRTELSSPSRHVSPSPERGPSPIRALSPLRPVSPSCYRSTQARTTPSPLGLQHRTTGYLPWESPGRKASHVKLEKRGTTGGERPTLPEANFFPTAFRLSTFEGYPSHQGANIFSHLPMHSQQARVPYLMISIGGIQMVHARTRSHPTTPTSPTSPPMEGPSQARFESYWGGTPRTQGLRTPGDHWSEHQAAGTSQSGRCSFSAALTCSKPESEIAESKQYGSSHSSAHPRRSASETTEPCFRDSGLRAALSPAAPVASRLIGQQPEREEPPSRGDLAGGGAKGDSARTDQST